MMFTIYMKQILFYDVSLESHYWVGLFFSRMNWVYNRNYLNVIKSFGGTLWKKLSLIYLIYWGIMQYYLLLDIIPSLHSCISLRSCMGITPFIVLWFFVLSRYCLFFFFLTSWQFVAILCQASLWASFSNSIYSLFVSCHVRYLSWYFKHFHYSFIFIIICDHWSLMLLL